MKRNDIRALHSMSEADLQKKLQDLSAQFAKAKLEKKVGKLANPRSVATLADDIARIKTVLTQKGIQV